MPDEYFDDLRINNKDTILTTPKYKHALPTLGMAGWVTDLAPATDFFFPTILQLYILPLILLSLK